MTELIIIKTNNSQPIKKLLQSKQISYEIYQEPKKSPKNIFAHYNQAIKNKQRGQELKLWDNVDLDEELNQDGEWWS